MTTLEKREIAPDTVAHIQETKYGVIFVAIIKTYYWGLHDEPEEHIVQAQGFKTRREAEAYITRYLQLSGAAA